MDTYGQNYKNELANYLKVCGHFDAIILNEFKNGSDHFKVPMNEQKLIQNIFRKYVTVLFSNATKNRDGRILTMRSDALAHVVEEGHEIPFDLETYKEVAFSSYKLAILTRIKTSFIQDNGIDILDHLSGEFARRFGAKEEQLILNGNGTSEPKGILTYTLGGHTSSSLSYDAIVKLYFSLNSRFRKNACFIMNDDTAMALRLLKDENGMPIWNSNNDTIFGRPVLITDQYTNSTKPILFGDLSYYYMIIREGVFIKNITELFIENNEYGYIATERFDGRLFDTNAFKVLTIQSNTNTNQNNENN